MTDFLRQGLKTWIWLGVVLFTGLVLNNTPAFADDPLPQDLIKQVGFDQRLGEQVPLDLEFTDSTGNPVRLGDYFGNKPVVLSLGYYECPMLCSLVRNGLFESLKKLEAFSIGKEFEVVIVSIDPDETPEIAEVKRMESMLGYGRSTSPEGWNFLVGDQENIKALADSIGFRYAYDPKIDEYVHPSGVLVLTPQGKIARYFYGIDFPANNLRLGLVEAAEGKIGSPVDQFLLTCYHYDPVSGEYTLAIMNIIRVIGVATVLIIGGVLLFMLKKERGGPTMPNPQNQKLKAH
ncbi:MAG: SCO family protein [Chloroflexi bacterium]|nr:MAG: SCO family protein [Chloroflexota bacterium]